MTFISASGIVTAAAFAALVVGLGVISVVWTRLSFGVVALLVRGAVRTGLYNPEKPHNRSAPASGKRDQSVLLFTDVLRFTSALVPGDPRKHPRTLLIPAVFVGIPLFFFFWALVWAIPLVVFGYVVIHAPGVWSFPLALLSLVAYYGVCTMLYRVLKRLPDLSRRVRQQPG